MNAISPGHFTLTDEQRQFKQLLTRYPAFNRYWDFDDASVDLDAVDRDIGAMSSGEQIMLRFFVAVWCGENLDFDFIDAVKTLDADHLQVITDWLKHPVFP